MAGVAARSGEIGQVAAARAGQDGLVETTDDSFACAFRRTLVVSALAAAGCEIEDDPLSWFTPWAVHPLCGGPSALWRC